MTKVAVVGAGVGGLAAALVLAARGCGVALFERSSRPGGKAEGGVLTPPGGEGGTLAGLELDTGPTVVTLKGVFEELFAEAGANLDERVPCAASSLLARHAWDSPEASDRLDLFADPERSAAAVAAFAGPREAAAFEAFMARAAAAWRALEGPFARAQRPDAASLSARLGPGGMVDLWRASPFRDLWSALSDHFRDPRLRQLFGRYATYSGCSPFEAPATLMLIAHVEAAGVWLPQGGVRALARAMGELAVERGVDLRLGEGVAEIAAENGRVAGVVTDKGEWIAADAVVCNADPGALRAGLLGPAPRHALPPASGARSLSAVTWALAGGARGRYPLARHNVFFGGDYRNEFRDLFVRRKVPGDPTVYVCAQDRAEPDAQRDGGRLEGVPDRGRPAAAQRDDRGKAKLGLGVAPDRLRSEPAWPGDAAVSPGTGESAPERFLMLVNAPAVGDERAFPSKEVEAYKARVLERLSACGLELAATAERATAPDGWAARYPGTGGALYGAANHGWAASFKRPAARTRLQGLYLAGGGAHPGAGLPMAALSGRLAAAALLEDADR